MSFTARFEPPTISELDVDLSQCETCKHKNYAFTCGQIGYCITDCGEGYVVGSILCEEKGYCQCNIDFVFRNGKNIPGVELYKRETKKFIDGLNKLGHTCELYQHPCGKKYLATVIIDGGVKPISLCHEFLKLEAVK